jgi:hypothetical protein
MLNLAFYYLVDNRNAKLDRLEDSYSAMPPSTMLPSDCQKTLREVTLDNSEIIHKSDLNVDQSGERSTQDGVPISIAFSGLFDQHMAMSRPNLAASFLAGVGRLLRMGQSDGFVGHVELCR